MMFAVRLRSLAGGMFTLTLLALILFTGKPAAAISYSNDFEGAVGSEWSRTDTGVTPTGARRFLGIFGNETVTLTLDGLPSQSYVTVSFDLFVMRSWDGNSATSGPDTWKMNVTGGSTLLETTFSNKAKYTQSYPDAAGGGNHAAFTGAAEAGTLGFARGEDSVYRPSFAFLHSGTTLQLNFSAFGLERGDQDQRDNDGDGLIDEVDELWLNENWGIDNIKVDAVHAPEPASLTILGAGLLGLLARRRRKRA